MMPEGWKEVLLANIAKIKSGSTPLRSKGNIYFSDSGTPWVKTLDLNNGEIESTSECVTDTAIRETSCSIFPKGTVLVAMYGGFNQIGRTGLLNIPATINQAISGLILNESDAEPSYVLNYLNGNVRKWKRFAASSRKDPNITRADVCAFPVLLPPLSEQKKIAQILSTWDKAITTTQQLLANSQHQKKALMQQLLTGKKRLLNDNGVRFSGEWKKGRLGDLAKIDSGYAFKTRDITNSETGIPIIRMSDFKTGGIDVSGAAKVSVEATHGLDRFKLKDGDFVFGMSGSLSNYGWVKKQDLPCFLNQRVGRIVANECAVQLFVTYLFLSDKIQQLILDKAAGAAQLNISVSDLRSTLIQYPCFEEQKKIASAISTSAREINVLEHRLAALKQEKKALMQQLLTGKRRVKVDEEAA